MTGCHEDSETIIRSVTKSISTAVNQRCTKFFNGAGSSSSGDVGSSGQGSSNDLGVFAGLGTSVPYGINIDDFVELLNSETLTYRVSVTSPTDTP